MYTPTISEIAQVITALSAVFAAGSSWINRTKINKVTMKVDRAVIVAAETKRETVEKTQEIKQVVMEKVQEVKEVAEAVNAEVVREVHDKGVEAGKAIAGNGKNHG